MAEPPRIYVTVTAPEGRMTPIHEDDGIDVGGLPLYVEPGWVRRVRWSQTTRRAWRRGDLILCNMDGKFVDSVKAAASETDLPGGKVASMHEHAHEHQVQPDKSFRLRLVSRERPLATKADIEAVTKVFVDPPKEA